MRNSVRLEKLEMRTFVIFEDFCETKSDEDIGLFIFERWATRTA